MMEDVKPVETPIDEEITEISGETKPDEEDVITIGDEEAPPQNAPDSSTIREMRQRHKDAKKEIRDLKEKLDAHGRENENPVGAKPTLEGCGYDNDQFEQKIGAWYEKKADDDRKQAVEDAEQARQNADWQKNLDDYGEKKAALKVHDFEDAEEVAKEAFSQTQQGIIVAAAENSAVVMYALGKNPKRAKEDPEMCSMIHVADIICRALRIGSGGDRRIPMIDRDAWERFR